MSLCNRLVVGEFPNGVSECNCSATFAPQLCLEWMEQGATRITINDNHRLYNLRLALFKDRPPTPLRTWTAEDGWQPGGAP